eukprot:1159967-Pelagomonas_calceolata.AAC.6
MSGYNNDRSMKMLIQINKEKYMLPITKEESATDCKRRWLHMCCTIPSSINVTSTAVSSP